MIMIARHFSYSRWPGLYYWLSEDKSKMEVYNSLYQNQPWLQLARQRTEVTPKIHKDLASLSVISYPHGEPPLAAIEALVSNNDLHFLEDELLEIMFYHFNDYADNM